MSWNWIICKKCGKRYGKMSETNAKPKTQVKAERTNLCPDCWYKKYPNSSYLIYPKHWTKED